jgi:ArsR family transcriptional regulator, virulence genes transcriptional regulator
MSALPATAAESLGDKAAEAARLLSALANPRRLTILCELAEGERSVGELVPIVGVQQAALSQHLARLRADGLVSTRRDAQMIFYRLSSPAAVAVINTLADLYCRPRTSKNRSRQ